MSAASIANELFVLVVIYAAVFLWLRESRPAFRRLEDSGVFVPATESLHIFIVLVLLLAGLAVLMVAERSLPVLPAIFAVLTAIALVGALSSGAPREGRLAPDQLPPGVTGPAYAEEPPTEPKGAMLGLRIAATAVGGMVVLRAVGDRLARMLSSEGPSPASTEYSAAIAAEAERARKDPRVIEWQRRMAAMQPAEGWEGPSASGGTSLARTSTPPRQRASVSPEVGDPASRAASRESLAAV
jgi:hypothetical protein